MIDMSILLGKIIVDISELDINSLIKNFKEYIAIMDKSDNDEFSKNILYEDIIKKSIVILCENENSYTVEQKMNFINILIANISDNIDNDLAIYLKYLFSIRVNNQILPESKKQIILETLSQLTPNSKYVYNINKDLLDIYIMQNNINGIKDVIYILENINPS